MFPDLSDTLWRNALCAQTILRGKKGKGMNFWEQRVELAEARFTTRFEVSSHGRGRGRVGVGVWAKTWHWGDMINDVCFHAHVPIAETETREDLIWAMAKAGDLVHEASFRARKAFPDTIPCQVPGLNPDGTIKIVLASYNTEKAREHRLDKGYDQTHFPPQDADLLPRREGGEAYLDTILALLSERARETGLRFDWQDDLNPYAEPRYARDPRPEVWQYVANPRIRSFAQTRVSAAGQHKLGLAERCPDGVAAARAAEQHIRTRQAQFTQMAPDLPCGYEIWPEPENPTPDPL